MLGGLLHSQGAWAFFLRGAQISGPPKDSRGSAAELHASFSPQCSPLFQKHRFWTNDIKLCGGTVRFQEGQNPH